MAVLHAGGQSGGDQPRTPTTPIHPSGPPASSSPPPLARLRGPRSPDRPGAQHRVRPATVACALLALLWQFRHASARFDPASAMRASRRRAGACARSSGRPDRPGRRRKAGTWPVAPDGTNNGTNKPRDRCPKFNLRRAQRRKRCCDANSTRKFTRKRAIMVS